MILTSLADNPVFWIAFFLIVAMVVLLDAAVIASYRKKKTETAEKKKSKAADKKSSTIRYGEGFTENVSVVHEENHVVQGVFRRKESSDIWVCPMCETENALTRGDCVLCHHVKE